MCLFSTSSIMPVNSCIYIPMYIHIHSYRYRNSTIYESVGRIYSYFHKYMNIPFLFHWCWLLYPVPFHLFFYAKITTVEGKQVACKNTWFSYICYSVLLFLAFKNHLECLLKPIPVLTPTLQLPPEILLRSVWGRAPRIHILTNFLVRLLLLVCRLDSK